MSEVKVVVKKCESYNPAQLYREVSDIFYQLKVELPAEILLKPNLLMPASPSRAITTHPELIGAVCKVIKEQKPEARIFIGDSAGLAGLATTKKAFEVCGINNLVKKYGLIAIPFEEQKLVSIRVKKAKIWSQLRIPEIVERVGLVINLPKLKTHTLTQYTGAIKNLYGCLSAADKKRGHLTAVKQEQFTELLLDLYLAVKPGLNIMDAIVGMEGKGPSSGRPKKTGLIIASNNALALDEVALKFIRALPNPLIENAKSRAILPDYKLVGKPRKVSFKLPNSYIRFISYLPDAIVKPLSKLLAPLPIKKPVICYDKCTNCYTCVKVCPVKAISIEKKRPVINYEKCISCLCCAEHCPYNAISIKQGLIVSLYNRIKKLVR